jgi:hypothetical protein
LAPGSTGDAVAVDETSAVRKKDRRAEERIFNEEGLLSDLNVN